MSNILILTNTLDTSTDWVVRELRRRRASFIRINADALAQCSLSFTQGSFLYQDPHGPALDLSDTVDIVYLRRPDPRTTSPQETSPDQRAILEFVDNQWRALMRGLVALQAKWINPISNNNIAEAKILQIDKAWKCGFNVPDTLVTNDPSLVHDFVARRKQVVVKALDTPLIETAAGPDFIYTQLVDTAILRDPHTGPEIMMAPVIYQDAIIGKTDVRVTVVGDNVIAAEIQYCADEIDWRRVPHGQTTVQPICLPPAIQDCCRRLTKACGLIYGSIDLGRCGNDYYFFELNPSGEWGWLQHAGLPIASAIADALVT